MDRLPAKRPTNQNRGGGSAVGKINQSGEREIALLGLIGQI